MDHDRPPLATYQDLARRIEHTLLDPASSEDDVRDGCDLAARYGAACVIVRPSDIDIAVRALRGTDTVVGAVVSWPHGFSNTAAKVFETRDLIRRGAREIDAVINTGKLISRQWPFLETEMMQLASACREEGVTLKAILDVGRLPVEQKLVACKIAKRVEAAFVGTTMDYSIEDIRLIAGKCGWRAQVKAGGITNLEQALEAWDAGAERFGTTGTATILDAWKSRLELPTAP